MDRAENIDRKANGEVIFTAATAKFQLKKGLPPWLEQYRMAPLFTFAINKNRSNFGIFLTA